MQKSFLAFCLYIISATAVGQSSFLRHYSINEGLPSSETYQVFQDSKGYIWTTSDMGVSRYDGYNFMVYTRAEGLSDNVVFNCYEDPRGRIWFIPYNGRLCYFFHDSIYGADMELNTTLHNLLGHELITSLRVDEHDTLWIAAHNGFYKASPVTKQGRTTWGAIQVINQVQTYLVDGGYVTAETGGGNSTLVVRYDRGITDSVLVPAPAVELLVIRKTADGSLMMLYSPRAFRVSIDNKVTLAENIKLGIGAVSDGAKDVWIGQKRNGVQLFSVEDLEHPIRNLLYPLTVTHVLKDHENGYWFTTLEDGLFYMPSANFTYYPPVGDSLLYDETTMQAIDSDRTWIIARFGIFESYRGQAFKEIFKNLLRQLPHYGTQYWWNAMKHSDGTVWLSGSGGVAVVDAKTEKLLHYFDFYKHHPNSEYSSRMLLEDADKNVWSLCRSNLVKINYASKQVEKLIQLPHRAGRMIFDNKGRLLIATSEGLQSYYNDTLQMLEPGDKYYKIRLTDLEITPAGLLGCSKDEGLLLYTPDSVYNLTKANGLTSNNCRGMFADATGKFWLATPKGINAVTLTYKPLTATVTQYNTSDGLLTNDADQILGNGSTIWVRSKKGITAFNPAIATENKVAPPVYITGITLNDIPQPDTGYTRLHYGAGAIGITFRCLTFKNPGRQLYKYKLDGIDTGWTVTQNNSVRFARLPAGNYRFTVLGINNSGVVSTHPAVYRFTIAAPFYQKAWFYALMFLVALGVVILIAALVVLRIRQREQMKTEINRRIANFQLQALRAQMNPHFIFNCLNAIQDFILMEEPEQAQHYLSSFSKLIRKTLDNSARTNISLTEEIDFLHIYLELERMRFVGRFTWNITVQPELKDREVEIPSMLVQPFVENAIRHGKLGGLERQGELNIEFSIKDEELVCVIDDNGIGINQSIKMKTRLPGEHELHAMEITNNRMRTLGEVHGNRVRYTLIDKTELTPAANGTRAEIFIPLTYDNVYNS